MGTKSPEQSPLGKKSQYANEYEPSLIFPISRKGNRDAINVPEKLPFQGVDIWNAFEISWLNEKGKPVIAIGELSIPCTTPNIVESKSMKLYLNSFNQSKFSSAEEVQRIIKEDLSKGFGGEISVTLSLAKDFCQQEIKDLEGTCIDDQDIEVSNYQIDPTLLKKEEGTQAEETLHSHLLKANCLVTGQPDWMSILIKYSGPKIDHEGLLRYIISFRNCNEFHEQCVERIYMDIFKHCSPEKLTVFGRCTRRGGLDINSFRSNFEKRPEEYARLARQ